MPTENNINPQKTKYDAICKSLLAKKYTLARIMQSCMSEYKDCSLKDIAEKYIEGEPEIGKIKVLPDNSALIDGMTNEDTSVDEGTVVYDIRFKALVPKNNEYINLIINVEAQADFNPGYPLIMRGIYYCSRMLSAQYNREFNKSHYEKLKKVVSIWVCTEPTQKRICTINKYNLTENNIIGNIKENPVHYDLMSVIMVCLGNPNNEDYNGILKYLDVLLSKHYTRQAKQQILENEFDYNFDTETEKEVNEMCNLAQAIEDKGREQGKLEGIAIGKQQGINIGKLEGINIGKQQGKFETTLANIQSLMYKVNWTAEQAMDALNIPQEEREQFLPKLQHLN